MHLKLAKKSHSKNSRSNGDLTGDKIADKITRSSKTSPQNKSETNEKLLIPGPKTKINMIIIIIKIIIKIIVEYQKIINLLDETTNQPSKFRTRNWVKINDESKGRYDNGNMRFKTSMIRSNLCDYSDSYILAKGTKTVANTVTVGAAVININKKVIFKNYAPFTNCITEINNTQVDDAQKMI